MNRAIHITPIITTDGSEHEKELLYLNKVATRTLDFVFVYMVTANMKTVLTNTRCLKSLHLQILSYVSETEFSAENQRAFHYEHWQRRALRFAHGFCDQTDSELKAERIDLVSKWLNVFQACYIFLSSFSDPSLLAMVTIM
jgi:hypothetical protein